MTSLRLRMKEDMQVRNLSRHTQDSYLLQVSRFARHFAKSPDLLGPEDIHAYQVYLTNEKKLAPGSVQVTVAALRFLYRVTLGLDWDFERIIPCPKAPKTVAVILSPEEVLHFRLHRELQAPGDPDDMLCRRPTYFRGDPPKA
jgi:integrase/recombinase XerD